MIIPIAVILDQLRPGEEYGRLGQVTDEDTYDKYIIWREEGKLKPTFVQVTALVDETDLKTARFNKNKEIFNFVYEAIRLRTGLSISYSAMNLVLLLKSGLNLAGLDPKVLRAIDMGGYMILKQKQINALTDLLEISKYVPSEDINFPKLI